MSKFTNIRPLLAFAREQWQSSHSADALTTSIAVGKPSRTCGNKKTVTEIKFPSDSHEFDAYHWR